MKNLPDKEIVEFINEQHALTLATCHDDEPYCANCFYTYLKEENILVFASGLGTKHIKQTAHNIFVAGSIFTETKNCRKIKGIQFQGYISSLRDDLYKKALISYKERFTCEYIESNILWGIDLTFLKFTQKDPEEEKSMVWENED